MLRNFLSLISLCIVFSVSVYGQSDSCFNAIPIACGDTLNGNTLASLAGDAPSCGSLLTEGPGAFFSFVGTGDYVELSTCNPGTDYDTRISVYDGACGALNCVAQGEDGVGCAGYETNLNFHASTGVTYYIFVHGFLGAQGNFELTLSCLSCPQPPNDGCSGAVPLTVFASGACVASTFDNTCASQAIFSNGCDGFEPLQDLWFSFNSSTNLSLDLEYYPGTATDIKYALYSSCGTPELECSLIPGVTNFAGLTPFTTYYLQVWNNGGSQAGTFDLCMEEVSSCIDPIPESIPVTNIGQTVASFEWTSSNAGATYFVEWDSAGFTPGSGCCNGSGASVTGVNTQGITGLNPGWTYDIYIIENCSGPTSNVVGPIAFSTVILEDSCHTALPISCGQTISGSTSSANISIAPTCGSVDVTSPGAWYEFLGTGDAITASVCNAASYDTKISVFIGSCSGLVCEAANDDNAPACSAFTSETSFNSVLGVPYYILVHGYAANVGDFDLSITCSTPCTPAALNEDCASALMLPVYSNGSVVLDTFDNTCTSINPTNPSCDFFGVIQDIWFEFNTGQNYQLIFHHAGITGSEWNIAIHETCGGGDLLCGATNVISGMDTISGLAIGTNYLVQYWNAGGAEEGTIELGIEALTNCADPDSIYVASATDSTITYEWISTNPGGGFFVEIGTTGYSFGTGLDTIQGISIGGVNSVTFTGLAEGTPYDIYLIEDCGGSFSTILGPTSFLTTSASCANPTGDSLLNITETTVDFQWTSSNVGAVYSVEYGPVGFVQGTGMILTGPSLVGINTENITGLSANTSYDIYLVENCGGPFSSILGPFNFTTLPIPCVDPSNVAVLNISETSSDVEWISGNVGATFVVEYGPMGFTPGSGSLLSGSSLAGTNSLPITGLTPGLDYDVYVVEDCGPNQSSNVGPNPFTTLQLCNDPGSTTIMVVSDTSMNVEWNSTNPGALYSVELGLSGFTPGTGITNTGTSISGMNTVFFEGLIPNTGYDVYIIEDCGPNQSTLIGPVTDTTFESCFDPGSISIMDIGDDSLNVEWNSMNDGATYTVELGVSGFIPGSGTTQVGTTTLGINGVTFSGLLPATDYDVYISSDCGPNQSLLIGPVTGTTLQSCFDPGSVSIVDLGYDSVNVEWNSMNDGAAFTVELGLSGFLPGSGTTQLGTTSLGINSVTFLGLVPATNYEVYISSDCGPNQSGLVGPVMFITDSMPCADPTAFDTTMIGIGSFEVEWNSDMGSISTVLEWGSPGFIPGTSSESGSETTVSTMGMNSIMVSNIDTLASFDIYLMEDCGFGSQSSWVGPISITTLAPSCSVPTDFDTLEVNTNDVELSWSSVGGSDNVIIEWGMPGFIPGTSTEVGLVTTVSVSGTNNFVVGGLDSLTEYDFFIVEECDFGVMSEWVGPVNIMTLAPPCVSPNYVGVDEITHESAVFTFESMNDSVQFYVEYGPVGFTPGMGDTISGMSSAGDNLVFISPLNPFETYEVYLWEDCGTSGTEVSGPFSFTTLETPCGEPFNFQVGNISFDEIEILWNNPNISSTYSLEYGPDGFVPGSGTILNGSSVLGINSVMVTGLNPETDYEFYLTENCSETNPSSQLGPIGAATLSESTCLNPINISIVFVSEDSATINWTSSNTGSEFYVEWGPAGFSPGSGTGNVVGLSSSGMNSLGIGGLFPSTSYDLYIIEDCGNGDLSMNIGPENFTTLNVAMDDELVSGLINIFPNPNKGVFSIRFGSSIPEGGVLEVINTKGQQVYTTSFSPMNKGDLKELDLGSVSKGVYILKIESKNVHISKKISIK